MLAGSYQLTAELSGFASTRDRPHRPAGRTNATIQLVLKLATLNENVTVTGASPLVETSQARVAGNVDRKQMEDPPIAGETGSSWRRW